MVKLKRIAFWASRLQTHQHSHTSNKIRATGTPSPRSHNLLTGRRPLLKISCLLRPTQGCPHLHRQQHPLALLFPQLLDLLCRQDLFLRLHKQVSYSTMVISGVVEGQVEVPVGQVNFSGSLPRLASNVLEPMLHTKRSFLL